MNVFEFLQIPATMFPDQEILVTAEIRLTYGQLAERVGRLAAALQQAGAQPGERVAVLDVNSHRYVEAYLAAAALGGAFIPLNYRAKAEELAYMIETGRAATLFYGERYRELLPPEGAGVQRYVALESGGGEGLDHEALIESLAVSQGGAEFAPGPSRDKRLDHGRGVGSVSDRRHGEAAIHTNEIRTASQRRHVITAHRRHGRCADSAAENWSAGESADLGLGANARVCAFNDDNCEQCTGRGNEKTHRQAEFFARPDGPELEPGRVDYLHVREREGLTELLLPQAQFSHYNQLREDPGDSLPSTELE